MGAQDFHHSLASHFIRAALPFPKEVKTLPMPADDHRSNCVKSVRLASVAGVIGSGCGSITKVPRIAKPGAGRQENERDTDGCAERLGQQQPVKPPVLRMKQTAGERAVVRPGRVVECRGEHWREVCPVAEIAADLDLLYLARHAFPMEIQLASTGGKGRVDGGRCRPNGGCEDEQIQRNEVP